MTPVFFDEKEHRYFLDEARTQEVPSVSRLLEHFGYANFDRVDPVTLEYAKHRGKVIHETLALIDTDCLKYHDAVIDPEIEGWQRFKDDHKPEFLLVEKPLASRVWRFAGTPDRLWGNTVGDIKTGAHTHAHPLQTAFYEILIEENFPVNIKKRMTVRLFPDGAYKIIQHNNRQDIVIAKALLTIYHDKKKKGLI